MYIYLYTYLYQEKKSANVLLRLPCFLQSYDFQPHVVFIKVIVNKTF